MNLVILKPTLNKRRKNLIKLFMKIKNSLKHIKSLKLKKIIKRKILMNMKVKKISRKIKYWKI
jgi:hypothetical protein